MLEKTLIKPAILMATIVVTVVAACEIYLRSHGITIAYDDAPPLWASKYAKVYEPAEKTVVFIGSSRLKDDLDIPVWEKMTNTTAVQLAIEGSSPRPVFDFLANDPNFKGRLIVDVTESLFFSNAPPNVETPNKYIKYTKDETPAQRVSCQINRFLESKLVFLDKNSLALNAKLDALELPSRKGVFMMPIFPMDFGYTTYERQNYMTNRFLVDSNLQNQVKNIWRFFNTFPHRPTSDDDIKAVLQNVKENVDKIKARGGDVLFVRTPSSEFYKDIETKDYPRERFWNPLLAYTNCKGVHYADYQAIDHFICPEYSHLSPAQASVFTREFIEILKESEKGGE